MELYNQRNRYMKKEYDPDYIFNLLYPIRLFIIEVNYADKDIAISEIRCERNKEPKEKDNSRGFTENYATYESAYKRAMQIAKELNFSL